MAWKGTEVIVFGGCASAARWHDNCRPGGARYNPVTRARRPLATANMPSARGGHAAVWRGTEMLIWGGNNDAASGTRSFADGALRLTDIADALA